MVDSYNWLSLNPMLIKAKLIIKSVCFFLTVREEVESDLTFLGLLIMENRLKRETKPVLEELNAACIRSVMVTGI